MYRDSDILKFLRIEKQPEEKQDVTCLHSRVSSSEQKTKGDLDRQNTRLVEYSAKKKYNVGYGFLEVGSGMSNARPKL